ncbi:MAG TPA: hypothetical protein VMG12_10205 [Polyangiaceae bacterium]|nr:hypothetical protein [Polyangiaceae bacterium]
MTDHARLHRNIRSWALAASMVGAMACRTSVDDVHRWANTLQGPRKIVAVMTHDKYPDDLRVEAAMTLVRMKPRSGRRVGIDELVSGLDALPAPGRAKIVTGMVPILEKEIQKAPPAEPAPGAARDADTTFPYKDAAFALLTNQGQGLVANDAERGRLKSALREWVMADFSARMDDSSQVYGMGQVLTELGAEGVRRLPLLITPDAKKIGSISQLVADLGDEPTKIEASQKLVQVASEVDSSAWLTRKAALLKQANEASGYKVDGPRFDAQLAQFQEEELLRAFSSLKLVGQTPAVDYLLGYAADKSHAEKRREAALAAMEGHVDRKSPDQATRLLAIAGADDTPDTVRDQAFRRVGELPRKQVIDALYALFTQKNWKVRWVAAELVLKMSEVAHLGEFMGKLGAVREMAITEPLRYGKLIAALPGAPPVREAIAPFVAAAQPSPVRLTALGYYLDQGTSADLAFLEPLTQDKARVPECAKGADGCEWQCEITSEGQQQAKTVQTVGDFVQYCVKPAIDERNKPVAAALATAKN